jgi:transcriptional regulator with XRE-family HTH domain
MATEPHGNRLERRRLELSDFLIRRRHALTPADVGLPATGRRRTPGLRREEVAALAGVGLAWYTWFEQGRDIKVSESFLLRVAKALKLDDAECTHLFMLAHRRPPPPESHQLLTVSPNIHKLLEYLPNPAYVQNLRWDIVAWNGAADHVLHFGSKPREELNLLRILFVDPKVRESLPEWQEELPKLLAQFRYDCAVTPDDPITLSLIEDLRALSPLFNKLWSAPNGKPPARGLNSILDPSGQRRDYHHETLVVDEYRHLRMVVYFPA